LEEKWKGTLYYMKKKKKKKNDDIHRYSVV